MFISLCCLEKRKKKFHHWDAEKKGFNIRYFFSIFCIWQPIINCISLESVHLQLYLGALIISPSCLEKRIKNFSSMSWRTKKKVFSSDIFFPFFFFFFCMTTFNKLNSVGKLTTSALIKCPDYISMLLGKKKKNFINELQKKKALISDIFFSIFCIWQPIINCISLESVHLQL